MLSEASSSPARHPVDPVNLKVLSNELYLRKIISYPILETRRLR